MSDRVRLKEMDVGTTYDGVTYKAEMKEHSGEEFKVISIDASRNIMQITDGLVCLIVTPIMVEKIEGSSNVNHPVNYQGKNECIDVMMAMFGLQAVIEFCKCNACKYRFRSAHKNGAEDIEKAEWYESKLIELMEECR